jgi:hypothetical protein
LRSADHPIEDVGIEDSFYVSGTGVECLTEEYHALIS